MDKKEKNKKKPEIKIKSLDIGKAEYQEIILSNLNASDNRWKRDEYR